MTTGEKVCLRCTNTPGAKKNPVGTFRFSGHCQGFSLSSLEHCRKKSSWAGATPQENNGDHRRRDVAGGEDGANGAVSTRTSGGEAGWKGKNERREQSALSLPGLRARSGAVAPSAPRWRRRGSGRAGICTRPSVRPCRWNPLRGQRAERVRPGASSWHKRGARCPSPPLHRSRRGTGPCVLFNALLSYHRPEKSFIHCGADSRGNCHLFCPVLPFC